MRLHYPIQTVGDLRRALEPYHDDALLLMPATIHHLDLEHGSRIEVNVADADEPAPIRPHAGDVRPMPSPYQSDDPEVRRG